MALMCFSTARLVRNIAAGDRGVALALGNEADHLELARRELRQRRALGANAGGDEALHDLRVDGGASARDLANRGGELAGLRDPVLQQVRAPGRPRLEETERVLGVGVLAEHHDAELRMSLARPGGEPDALVGSAWRHADVGDDDVGLQLVGGLLERLQLVAVRDRLDVRLGVDQLPQSLADEVVILPDDHLNWRSPPRSILSARLGIRSRRERARSPAWHHPTPVPRRLA